MSYQAFEIYDPDKLLNCLFVERFRERNWRLVIRYPAGSNF